MIRVNTETCIGCGMCEKDCLASAIRVEDGKAKVKMKCMDQIQHQVNFLSIYGRRFMNYVLI